MRRRIIPVAIGAAALAVTGWALPGAASATQHNAGPVVVVTGLNNPRQLAWGANGTLLVAEAGRGSPTGQNCFSGPEGTNCAGATGSISMIRHPGSTSGAGPHRIVRHLLSAAAPDGGSAVGSDGVSSANGRVLIQETNFPPDALAGLPGWQSGKLLVAGRWGVHTVADISAVEFAKNPDGLQVDSNPYAVKALGSNLSVSTDAAGNDLIRVRNGKARPLTVLPLHGCGGVRSEECDQEPVPTSLALGPHGALYVGELAHFEPGEARVWQVSPSSGKLLGYYGAGGSICDTAFSTITGIAFGPDGSLYASELIGGANGQGDVVRVRPDCTTSSMPVPAPAGLAVDRHGNVYVSAYSISDRDGAAPEPGAPALPPGQIWRIHF